MVGMGLGVGGGKEVSKNMVDVAREDDARTQKFSV